MLQICLALGTIAGGGNTRFQGYSGRVPTEASVLAREQMMLG